MNSNRGQLGDATQGRSAGLELWIFLAASLLFGGSLLYKGGAESGRLYIALIGGVTWALALWRYSDTGSAERTALSIGMIAFPAYLVLSAFWSIIPAVSLEIAGTVGAVAISYWLVRGSLRAGVPWYTIAWMFRAMGTIAALAALVEYAVTRGRTMGLFLDFNAQAGFFAALSLWTAGDMLTQVRSGARLRELRGLMLGLAVLLAALATTRSLGALLAFSGGTLLFGLIAGLRRPGTLKVMGVLACGLVLATGFVRLTTADVNDPLEKLGGLESHASFTDRVKMARSAVQMYADHQPLGVGLGSYKVLYRAYRDPTERSTTGDLAHNDYAQFLAEGGPILLAFPLLLVTWLLLRGWQLARSTEISAEDGTAAGMIAALLALSAHAAMNFIFYIMAISLLMGAFLARLDRIVPGATRKPPISRGAVAALLAATGLLLTGTLGLRSLFLTSLSSECEFNLCRQLHQHPEHVDRLAKVLALTQPSWIPARVHRIDAFEAAAQLQTDPLARTRGYREAVLENLSMLRVLPAVDIGYSRLAELLQQEPELALMVLPPIPDTVEGLFRKALTLDPLDVGTRLSLARTLELGGQSGAAFTVLAVDGMVYWKIPTISKADRLKLASTALELGLRLGRCVEVVPLADAVVSLSPGDARANQVRAAGAMQAVPGCGLPPTVSG